MPVCTACGDDVLLRETVTGVEIALAPEPHPLGMLYIGSEDGKVRPWTHHIGRSVPRYQSHTYRCLNAAEVEGSG
jgi:hypothetical protein